MKEEIWKFYIDNRCYRKDGTVYKGGYWEISNYGNVKKNGVLYSCPIKKGYKMVPNNSLHRAVAELFIPNPENKPFIDHIDTNPLNNHVNNLHWVTPKENANNPLTLIHLSESRLGEKNGFYNKHHSKEQREKWSKERKGSLRTSGSTGYRWVNNGKENKLINPKNLDEYLKLGYTFGKLTFKQK